MTNTTIKKAESIIQLKITLLGTDPAIWRRLLVKKNTTFENLHHIIQIAMGWTNSHLYEFNIKGYRIAEPVEEFIDYFEDNTIDPYNLSIDHVIKNKKIKFNYVYDFGDHWEHQIEIEKFIPVEKQIQYPVCIDGKLNCPPEDCGSISGFYSMLEIIGDRKHPERKEMLQWLGGEYKPEHFDLSETNKELKFLHSYKTDYKGYWGDKWIDESE